MYTQAEIVTVQAHLEMALHEACVKHPTWEAMAPSDMFCILMEEVGEAAQALNDRRREDCIAELIQAGAVIQRMLIELKRYRG